MSYFRLLRLSNAPTAVADVIMGIVIATGGLLPYERALLLMGASLSLYHGGMVLNDVADVEQDRKERAKRPIVAGEISEKFARILGQVLLLFGIGLCLILGYLSQEWWPAVVASLLAVAIVSYNSPLKKSKAGPWLMGLCRGLNGMLGLSLVGSWEPILLISPGLIAYVAGLTLFARDEAGDSPRRQLITGAVVSMAGIGWLAISPFFLTSQIGEASLAMQETKIWFMLWFTVMLMIGRHYLVAIVKPSPKSIQRAVVGAIQGLIVINAVLVFGYAGVFYGLAILALLPISKLLSLVIPAT